MKVCLFVAIAAVLVLSACGSESATELPAADTTALADAGAAPAATPIYVADLEYSRHPSGRQEVSGRLINQSDRSLRNAQVQIALYDEYNRPIDRLMVVVRGVAPGNDMAFRQTVDNEQAVGAKVRSIMTQ